jgi:glucose dehydrogenase
MADEDMDTRISGLSTGSINLGGPIVTAGGKQYVVIAAGGHGKLGTKQGDYVLAFAIP